MQKKKDEKNRWQYKTVGFRMSQAESDELDALVRLSGLTKQDYIISRVLVRDIVVNPNPRVFKALRCQLEGVSEELNRLAAVGSENEELIELTGHIAGMLRGMKGEE